MSPKDRARAKRQSLSDRWAGWQNQRRITSLADQVARQEAAARPQQSDQAPVAFFNASTRLTGLSQNAAFSLLTGWALRLAGVPVVHFVCKAGMSHCVLGTNREDFTTPPPCDACVAQSRRLYHGANIHWFTYTPEPDLAVALNDLGVEELAAFEYQGRGLALGGLQAALPLGKLALPSIRWALRRHHLPDDEPTRYLLREYIASAYSLACQFNSFLDQHNPASLVLFNGMMYPEATARWVAGQRGLRVVSHEVGFQRFSAFFTEGQPTAYPIPIPDDFELSPEQTARLDSYLAQRFQGEFSMAGITFWPEMRGLDEAFLQRAAQFRQVVPVFTNVIYDTSQVHANVVFPHMFAWLDVVLELIRAHPETLFVIRAHPDEMRPGTAKQSRESVRSWVMDNRVNELPNVTFIDSQEYISSYELIQRSGFVMVYNSSIGLEATLLGKAVLCGGKARYTQYPSVYFPQSQEAFREQAESFLAAGEAQLVRPDFVRNARRFLYYQLYRASLPFDEYLQSGGRPGFVHLRPFSWQALLPENSVTVQVLLDGILDRAGHEAATESEKTFLMPEAL